MDVFPDNVVDLINEHLGGYNTVIGLRFVEASPDEFVAELTIDDHHLQPYGLVHGGVYAGMIESLCSTGAALSVWAEGKSTVSLENTTAFLRAVRSGTLRGTARPLDPTPHQSSPNDPAAAAISAFFGISESTHRSVWLCRRASSLAATFFLAPAATNPSPNALPVASPPAMFSSST